MGICVGQCGIAGIMVLIEEAHQAEEDECPCEPAYGLAGRLLSASLQPYLRILHSWIGAGRLQDLAGEMPVRASATLGEEDTAAHWAAKEGNIELAKLLHAAGADFTVHDRVYDTPFDLAKRKRRQAMVEWLGSIGVTA